MPDTQVVDRATPTVIAIANRKGGSGKTTVAVNLAAGFAASGWRTLLIDLDSQGHCAIGLGLTADRPAANAHRLLLEPDLPAQEAVLASAWDRLALLPADRDFQHGATPHDERRLQRVLEQPLFARHYDLILIDTPPSFDLLLLNALAAARWVLVPFVPHHLAAEGVRQLSRALFKVAMTTNAELRLLGLLPMMVDPRVGLHRDILGQLTHQFGAPRMLAGIRADIKLAEAFAAGQPVCAYAPRSRGARDFASLADAIGPSIAAHAAAATGAG